MKKLLTLLICLPLFSLGQQTINASITHGGLQRDYILYVPASYSSATAVPLVFNFHGYTSNANDQMWYGDFRAISDTAGFIIVHPMGTIDNTGATHWNVGWGGSTVDDIDFTEALMDDLIATYSIDNNRIYSTGMSNGGFMSYQLACELSDRIAAIASVTGSMNMGWFNSCNPNHPMPVMEIHGTLDPTVSYNASSFTESIPDIMDFWANFNNCNNTPIVTNVPDINIMDGCTAEHQIWENGDNEATVEHYKIINGGHTWPGTVFASAGTNQDINASAEIWRFFSKYDINGLINPTVLPTAFIYGNDTICYNQNIDAQVTVSFSGATPPFTFVYAINGVSQPSITTTINPYVISTQQAGAYTVQSYNDANNTGTISGSALVTVNTSIIDCPPPLLIKEHTTNKELLKITDILGKETTLKNNNLLFYIYNDGTVEKKIILE